MKKRLTATLGFAASVAALIVAPAAFAAEAPIVTGLEVTGSNVTGGNGVYEVYAPEGAKDTITLTAHIEGDFTDIDWYVPFADEGVDGDVLELDQDGKLSSIQYTVPVQYQGFWMNYDPSIIVYYKDDDGAIDEVRYDETRVEGYSYLLSLSGSDYRGVFAEPGKDVSVIAEVLKCNSNGYEDVSSKFSFNWSASGLSGKANGGVYSISKAPTKVGKHILKAEAVPNKGLTPAPETLSSKTTVNVAKWNPTLTIMESGTGKVISGSSLALNTGYAIHINADWGWSGSSSHNDFVTVKITQPNGKKSTFKGDYLDYGGDHPVIGVDNEVGAVPVFKTMGDFKISISFKRDGKAFKSYTKTLKVLPAKAKISKATSGKKKLTVKYGKVAGGCAYQIAYKLKGGKWKYVTTTKTSKTISKLKSKKTYQVKVRAYKKGTKVKYAGAWSAVKTVKVK